MLMSSPTTRSAHHQLRVAPPAPGRTVRLLNRLYEPERGHEIFTFRHAPLKSVSRQTKLQMVTVSHLGLLTSRRPADEALPTSHNVLVAQRGVLPHEWQSRWVRSSSLEQ